MTASPLPATSDATTFVIPDVLGMINRVEFRNRVLDALRDGARNIVLDFGSNTYTDSSGMAVLVTINRETRKVDGTCTLINVGERLRAALRTTKLDNDLTIQEAAPSPP